MKTLLEIIDTTGTRNILNEKPMKAIDPTQVLKDFFNTLQTITSGPKQEFMEIERCIWCDGEVTQRSAGNEGWAICGDCGTVEGDTKTYYECSLCLAESETEECNCKKP